MMTRDEIALEGAKEILRHGIKLGNHDKATRMELAWRPIAEFAYEFADALIEESKKGQESK